MPVRQPRADCAMAKHPHAVALERLGAFKGASAAVKRF